MKKTLLFTAFISIISYTYALSTGSYDQFLTLCRSGTAQELENFTHESPFKAGFCNKTILKTTGLIEAAKHNNIQTMAVLIEKGANPYKKDIKKGWGSLQWAAASGSQDAVRYLIDTVGLAINESSGNGWSALHAAAATGNIDMASFLIYDYNAPAFGKTFDKKQTPMDIATEKRHDDVALFIYQQHELIKKAQSAPSLTTTNNNNLKKKKKGIFSISLPSIFSSEEK